MGARLGWIDADPSSERPGGRLLGGGDEGEDRRGIDLLTPAEPFAPTEWAAGGHLLSNADHTLVMGVLNVTPDSFSDGGRFLDRSDAIGHGMAMWEAGADLIDVGGESTRPGSEPVGPEEELERVIPVIERLAGEGILASVDSSKAVVASAAVEAGAVAVNDVAALRDPDMASAVAASGAGLVLMHMRGEPRTMQDDPTYEEVVADVTTELLTAVGRAEESGVDRASICLDPGIGFGKTLDHNLELLRRGVSTLAAEGFPVLVGASRKSFITKVLGEIEPDQRDAPSAVAHALAIGAGAFMIRAHNVVMSLRTARMADAIVRHR